ncbi:hypothetical protein QBC33DRAFT_446602 [Phialemonium atrogriseum]|uniref:Rhodopsin domain-containing protein n=1 Tax=Phialemonium atrogriseum TaxID=1093897 RepID=A0AAJ0C7P6_9PEZI|nr:uncharacterized protein QBC33DRAFT_446602 [Phialemonium atrogriseum]KAK1770194.1 hypothetical protein QBC33DRAFT_446602 [Phialemonium atrogriseum]
MKRSPNDDASPALLSINFILLAVVVVTTSLRLYTRFSLRALGWDDYTITATALVATTRVAIQAAQVQYGNGRHRQYISNEDYVTNNMLGWYAQLLLFVSMTLLKISIGLLLLRIRNTRVLRIFLCCLISGVIITNLTCIIVLLSECSPVSAYWKGGGSCWDTRVRIYAIYITIGYSLMTDFICSLLPLAVVWKVQIPLKKKLMIWGLMSMGLVATAFGAVRAASLGLQTDDLSWVYCIAAIWSNLELFLGITAANLALSRSVWMFLRHGRRANTSGRTQSQNWTSPPSEGSSRGSGMRMATTRSATSARTEADEAARGGRGGADGGMGRRPGSEGSDIPLHLGVGGKNSFWALVDYERATTDV